MYSVKELPTAKKPRKIKYVCPDCGREDITSKAYVQWDKDEQKWIVIEIDYDAEDFCEDCECHVSAEEVYR